MSSKNTKSQILKKIQEYYGFKKQVEFADFLGITPNCLNGWYKNERLNYEIVSTMYENQRKMDINRRGTNAR